MKLVIVTLLACCSIAASAQDAALLVKKVKAKIDLVNNYEANGTMKTNVSFLKVPEATVKIYFKKPNQLKIKNEKGLSFVPKGAVSINLSNLLAGDQYSIIDAGKDKVGNTVTRVVKLLPTDDNAEVVLSTLYIDETNLVILKAKTTTRENGSYQLDMTFGKYLPYGLPDKIVFTFNTKDYKLPKGVTFDFDDGSTNRKPADKNNHGRAEIIFTNYIINKGIPDSYFK
jgi:outer membrane lipoprotein-sorting protein